MRRTPIAAALLLVLVSIAHAESMRVVEIARNDALMVREMPSTEARIVGIIPPDTRNVRCNGDCLGEWVFVKYKNVEGYVSSQFLIPENSDDLKK